ncbi:MAG: bacteriophage holin [Gemmatimonadales bacterium]
MSLNTKALGIALGIAWGAGVLCVGLTHLIWPGYGGAFLDLVASVYPGYHVGGFGSVIIGTLYAVVDGAVCGAIIGWMYNMAAHKDHAPR